MATAPQQPYSQLPPQPPRSGSTLIAIALVALALVVLLCVLALQLGMRFITRAVRVRVTEGGSGKKAVSIRTPVGSLDVAREINEARLGLPIYPGAKRVVDDSATVNIQLPEEEGVRVVAAKFETSDSIEKVRAFYQARIGSEVTKRTEKDLDGKTVFEIKRAGQEKVVALKGTWPGTRIELVRIEEGPSETN